MLPCDQPGEQTVEQVRGRMRRPSGEGPWMAYYTLLAAKHFEPAAPAQAD